MATASELAEARAHERRRLAIALVTGSLPEHTTTPPSTGRAVLGGLALAVLLAAAWFAVSVVRAG